MEDGCQSRFLPVLVYEGCTNDCNHAHHEPEDRMFHFDVKGLEREAGADKKDQLIREVFEFGELFKERDKEAREEAHKDDTQHSPKVDDEEFVAHRNCGGDAVNGEDDIGHLDQEDGFPKSRLMYLFILSSGLRSDAEHVLHGEIQEVRSSDKFEDDKLNEGGGEDNGDDAEDKGSHKSVGEPLAPLFFREMPDEDRKDEGIINRENAFEQRKRPDR